MGKAAHSISKLPLHCVDVVEAGEAPRPHRVGCEIGRDLYFDTTGLEAYCFANWDARVFDAFVLAAAVQFCDHTKARSSVRWGREIELRIPVHDPAHWGSAAVSEALHAALEILTGDRWQVEFVGRTNPEEAPASGTSICRTARASSSPSAMASTRSQSLDCWSVNTDRS